MRILYSRVNVRRYRLGRRVRVMRSDLFSALRGRRYDLIVSNPPFVISPENQFQFRDSGLAGGTRHHGAG